MSDVCSVRSGELHLKETTAIDCMPFRQVYLKDNHKKFAA